MSDLLFWKPAGGTDLLFGDSAEPAAPHYDATITATFPALSVSIKAIPTAQVTVTASFPALSMAGTAAYASYASRPIAGQTASDWQRGDGAAGGVTDAFQHSAQAQAQDFTPVEWTAAACASGTLTADLANADRLSRHAASMFQNAERIPANRHSIRQQDGQRDRRLARDTRFQGAVSHVGISRGVRHQDADHSPRHQFASAFASASTVKTTIDALFGVGTHNNYWITAQYQEGTPPPAGRYVRPVTPVDPAYTPPSSDILFHLPWANGSPALLFGDTGEANAATLVIPVRRTYIVINTQSLVRISDGLAIPATDIKISIDVDSWAWGWSASVPAAYLDALQAELGNLVELQAQVNGHAFRLAVESIQRNRSFGKSTLAVSGRSRAAWLAAPYAEIANRANTTQMTAQQLMALALTENGASLGWDVDWQITDWLVPAGVWSHSGTAIEACMSIAEAVGAYIQSDPNDQVLRVQPRYPVAPWGWDGLTPDIELPEDVCVTEGIEFVDKPVYNTVFISGQAQGVLGHVTRGGTDGGRAAPMITDLLVTHADAARQRGTAVLSDTGRQKLISLSLPVLDETGIILPGKLVRYTESGKTHLGLSRAVDVSSNFPKVRQTIMLESHVL